jgi:hypothetical protein
MDSGCHQQHERAVQRDEGDGEEELGNKQLTLAANKQII